MDTILYFYRKRDLKEAWVEPVGLKSYMLIRVGLNVKEGEWFGIRPDTPSCLKTSVNTGNDAELEISGKNGRGTKQEVSGKVGRNAKQVVPPERMQSTDKTKEVWQSILRFPVRTVKRLTGQAEGVCGNRRPPGGRRKLRHSGRDSVWHKEAEEQERLQAEQAEKIRRVEDGIKALAAEILELAGKESCCYAVYDDSVRKVMLKESEDSLSGMVAFGEGTGWESVPEEAAFPVSKGFVLPSLWNRHMEFEEFSGYTKAFWIGLLLPNAVLHHFVILGTAPCIFEVIEEYASRMKSLKWILSQEECSPELLEFVEDFYTEYGLAIALQTLPGGDSLKGMGVLCSLPSNILDFTGNAGLNVPETARGSIWLDFLSVEEKRRRVERRCPGVSYFSLKEKWRHAQRRCKEPLLP